MIRIISTFLLFQCCLTNIFGQAPNQNNSAKEVVKTKPVTGTITGQISGGDGQKFADISVSIFNPITMERHKPDAILRCRFSRRFVQLQQSSAWQILDLCDKY